MRSVLVSKVCFQRRTASAVVGPILAHCVRQSLLSPGDPSRSKIFAVILSLLHRSVFEIHDIFWSWRTPSTSLKPFCLTSK